MIMNAVPNGIRLMLPWPDPLLNPNNHSHWRVKLDARQTANAQAFALAYNLHTRLDPEKHYQVELIFCPPNRRTHDLDNLVSSLKNALDGMCRGLGINDKMIRPVPDWGPVIDGGKVEVTITERVAVKEVEILDGKR